MNFIHLLQTESSLKLDITSQKSDHTKEKPARLKKDKLITPLLLHINLSTTLPNLTLIMNIPPLLLLFTIPLHSRANRCHGPLRAILHPLSPIRKLALSLSLLTSSILLDARATQVLVAEHVAQTFLGRADSLVP